jgi:hypothetical protein
VSSAIVNANYFSLQCNTLSSHIYSFIHPVVCRMVGSQLLSKQVLHYVRSSASAFNFQYLILSLRSSSSCLHVLPWIPVTSIFPSMVCFRRQFLHKMWLIYLVFLLFIMCWLLLSSLTVCNTSLFLTRLVQVIFSIILQHHITRHIIKINTCNYCLGFFTQVILLGRWYLYDSQSKNRMASANN